MLITFGTAYVGKVDRVPGTCYVVTAVFQIANIPLVPLRGYLVREGSEQASFVAGLRSFQGQRIEVSGRSFMWAVARALLFGGGLLAILGVLPFMLGVDLKGPLFLASPVLGLVMLAVWWRTRRGLLATPERARELEMRVGATSVPGARIVRG